MFKTIKSKLVAGFASLILVCVVVGAVGLRGLAEVNGQIHELSMNLLPSLSAIGTAQAGFLQARLLTARAVTLALMNDPSAQGWRAKRDEALATMHEGLKQYGALPMTDREKEHWRGLDESVRWWEGENEKTWAAIAAHDGAGAAHIQEAYVADANRRVVAPLAKLAELQETLGHEARGTAEDVARSARLVMLVAIAIALLFGSVFAFLIIRSVASAIASVVRSARLMRDAVTAGRLGERADGSTVSQEFRPILTGLNDVTEAFVKPIEVTADYVDRIAKGDLPPKITDRYEGDFNRIKDNLNQCIEAVKALVADATALSEAAVEGKLSTRADASKHRGDYRKIVQGVNETLDAVLGPIDEASAVLQKLAERDLTVRVKGSYQGDHAKIKEALNATAQALHDAMSQVARAVEQVSSASGQIAASSQAVASGASEQAASLEETSSSLESMASTTKQAADNAQQANGLAQQAKAAATEGSAAVEQMTGAMAKIKTAAAGTSQIIKDINEIAFQTNLLALNAAVEAARAGEAGRGFAVVAEEVRSLALRSKQAATKTEELIHQSVTEAGEGEVTAKHVQAKLADIAGSISKATDIVAEMAASAKEQSVGIEQVSKAMEQMNQVTQQNAASSEESSSAATELSGQAQELAAMAATFRCDARSAEIKRAAPRMVTAAATPAPNKARKGNGARANGKPSGAVNGHVAVGPESIIPLDGDMALQDF